MSEETQNAEGAPEGDNPSAPETVLTAPEASDAPATQEQADWRAGMAGDDEAAQKRLNRFKTPGDVWKSYTSLEKKLAEGSAMKAPGEDATPEDIAAYRQQVGIPDAPEGYLEKLPDGIVIGDDDKEMATSFLTAAHERNMPPEMANVALQWYYESQEKTSAAIAEMDKALEDQTQTALRDEWGGEYRPTINAINNFLEAAPNDDNGVPLKDLLMDARLANGDRLGNNAAALRWLADLANEANPAGFVSPSTGQSQMASVESRIAEIEGVMRTDRGRYNKDKAMQDELLKLYAAQDKMQGAK